MWFYLSDQLFLIVRFWISTKVVYLSAGMAGATWNAAILERVLCTPYNHPPCHFMQSHIHKVYACLAVTCHLHFWQHDRDLLRAAVVTQGWNGYWNKSEQKVDPGEEISPTAPGIQVIGSYCTLSRVGPRCLHFIFKHKADRIKGTHNIYTQVCH